MGNSMLFNKEKCKNMRTPGILVVKSVCKHATVKNVDGSKLQLCHLHCGEDGLLNTLTADYSKDQPRATIMEQLRVKLTPSNPLLYSKKGI